MSETVVLSLRAPLDAPLDVSCVAPDRLAVLTEREIAELPVWSGAWAATLGDFFEVRGGSSARVRVEGATAGLDGLGSDTTAGELVVDGDAGREVAARMAGGRVEVRGSVGDDAGVAMGGGVLRVAGNAGDRLGAAGPGAARGMTGGEIVVDGSAGSEAGARARRGLVVVGGDAGERAARSMIAGTLVVLGRAAAGAGTGSKRGSVIAVGGLDVPATYQYACDFRPPHVRLVLTYVRRRYALPVDEAAVGGVYRRYCGDAGDVGKGEILRWIAR